jgi:hypothetical protein
MNDINAVFKENFAAQLKEIKSLPVDLAQGYKRWVRSLVQNAAQQLAAQKSGAQQGGEQAQQ